MKKKKFKLILIFILISIIPFDIRTYKDGGTKTYTSLTYKIIKWNELQRLNSVARKGTQIVLFPYNFMSLDYFKR